MIALGIIESEPGRRATLRQYIGAQPELACVLCVSSHVEFVAGLAELASLPRLVLVGVYVPGHSGLLGLADLRQRLPEVEVVVLSGHPQAECVVEALRAGAAGYLEYATPLPLLKEALLQVAAGGAIISTRLARVAARYLHSALATTPPADLTTREQQVLRGLADGLSYQGIADQLFLSLDTVRTHIRQVYRKLDVNSRPGLLAKLQKQE